ncbi:MAG: glycosyltransferase family 39 protein [Bacteroidales bacterium]|nr:glycosyltransferase family 39 protein [Bacteroidales bacterium]
MASSLSDLTTTRFLLHQNSSRSRIVRIFPEPFILTVWTAGNGCGTTKHPNPNAVQPGVVPLAQFRPQSQVQATPILRLPRAHWRGMLGCGVLLIVYLLFAQSVPAADDELYYWCWAQHLQLSYFDHPGMCAYLIRVATELFGHSLLAIRLPAMLSSLFVLGVITHLSRPRVFIPLLVLSPLFSLGAVLVTPDTPLLLFWAGYLVWLHAVHVRLTPPNGAAAERVPVGLWCLGGVILGCGALSKYTMVLAVPAGCVSFLLARGVSWRVWLPGYIGHGVISAILTTPIVVFNSQYDFAPLLFQWEHAHQAAQPGTRIISFVDFVSVQILFFGILPIVLLPWVWWRIRTLAADPRLRVCAALYAVPMTIFLYKATQGPLEGNWALVAFIGFWPIAAAWYAGLTAAFPRWLAGATLFLPAGCSVLLAAHLVEPLMLLPPHRDRITRQAGRLEVAHQAAQAIHQHGEAVPVFTTSYQMVAALRFHGLDARQIAGATRPSNFTLTPERLEQFDRVYVFSEGLLPASLVPGFGSPKIVANLPLIIRGELITCYQVLLYTKPGDRANGSKATETAHNLGEPLTPWLFE